MKSTAALESPQVVVLDGYEHTTIHTRAIRLHAVTAGERSNPAIVLLHDNFGGWFDFRRLLEPLTQAGYYAIALDIRGFGFSDKPPAGYNFNNICGDIAGLIRTLGHEKAHVLGVGTGAAIGWVFATAYPEHILSLTAVDGIHPMDMRRAAFLAPWRFPRSLGRLIITRLPSIALGNLWQHRDWLVSKDLHATTTNEYQQSEYYREDLQLRQKAMSIESTFPPVIRVARLRFQRPRTKWQSLKVNVPVLLIGDTSRQFEILSQWALGRCRSSLRVVTIPGAQLRPHMEAPKQLVAVLREFLES